MTDTWKNRITIRFSWIKHMSLQFRKKYNSVLLPHADWAILLFVRYLIAQQTADKEALARIDKEMLQ